MQPELKNWLNKAIGQKLESVLALIHVFDGEKNVEQPNEIDLQFTSCGHGLLRCGPDGATIVWNDEGSKEVDIGELGHFVIEDFASQPTWATVMGKTLVGADLIQSEGMNSGVKLLFEGEAWVAVLNWGDELYVFHEMPEWSDDELTFTNIKNIHP